MTSLPQTVPLLLLVLLTTLSAGCEAIGNIFQAGMVVGVLIVVLVLGLVGWLISRVF